MDSRAVRSSRYTHFIFPETLKSSEPLSYDIILPQLQVSVEYHVYSFNVVLFHKFVVFSLFIFCLIFKYIVNFCISLLQIKVDEQELFFFKYCNEPESL